MKKEKKWQPKARHDFLRTKKSVDKSKYTRKIKHVGKDFEEKLDN